MKTISLFLLLAYSLTAQSITWTKATGGIAFGGGSVGYDKLTRDSVAGGMLIGSNVSLSSAIFVTDWYHYSAAGVTVHIGGTGSADDSCAADLPFSYGGANPGGLPNRPGPRHPVSQVTTDTSRGLLWTWGGVINNCSTYQITVSGTGGTLTTVSNFAIDGSWVGARVYVVGSANCPNVGVGFCTIASVTDGTHLVFSGAPGNVTGASMVFVDPGNGTTLGIRNDMYYMTLNSSSASNAWTRVQPAATPTSISGGSYGYQGSLAYDPDDDALYHVEITKLFRYCSTIGNPGGTLTAAQTAGGCATGDTWTLENSGAPGQVYQGWVYDPVRKIFWKYGGSGGNTSLWAYNPGGSTRFGITSHTWLQFCGAGCTAPAAENNTTMSEYAATAWNSTRNVLHFHFSSSANGVNDPADYEYDPLTDRWTSITSNGGPAGNNGSVVNGCQIDYDVASNSMFSYAIDGVWRGQLPAVAAAATKFLISQ